MRTITAEQLATILAKHRDWLIGKEGGERANLQSADLRSADLQSADLRSANLQYANLQSADLQSADLRSADLRSADLQSADLQSADLRSADLQSADLNDETNLTGESWKDYLTKVVPALCTAGGKTLVEVSGAWDCHSWENCPMSVAFGVHSSDKCPPLLIPRVNEFVRLFDAKLIPRPVPETNAVAVS